MTKYLLAAALIVGFAAPAMAMGPFYIVFDKEKQTCSMVDTVPSDTDKFAMMGNYRTKKAAHMAMEGMTKCQ